MAGHEGLGIREWGRTGPSGLSIRGSVLCLRADPKAALPASQSFEPSPATLYEGPTVAKPEHIRVCPQHHRLRNVKSLFESQVKCTILSYTLSHKGGKQFLGFCTKDGDFVKL